jgi:hypothetical protein
MTADIGLDIAQSLTSIVVLYRDLEDEALHRYADKNMPGGDALNYLGPVANLEAYGYRQLSDLMGRTKTRAKTKDGDLIADPETDDAPPLLVLASWHDVIREHRGFAPSEVRASITKEADGIRASIDWMLAEDHDGLPNFLPADELAKDLRRVVARLENVLKAGERADRIKAECKFCPPAPRLSVRHGANEDHSDDSWFCSNCNAAYDIAGVSSCWRQMLVKRGDPPEWVSVMQASTALARSPKSIRNWIKDENEAGMPITPKVASRVENGRIQINWADARAVDDTTHRRGRYRQMA